MNRAELLLACFGPIDFAPGDVILEVTDGADVLAHVDVYKREVIVGHARVTVAGIAQVCTDPRYRRQGFARSIVRAAGVRARMSGIQFGALWSEYRGLYGPLGYLQVRDDLPTFLVAALDGVKWPSGEVDTQGQW